MYTIHTSKSNAETKFLLDYPSPAELPAYVIIGVGSIEKRYLKYLNTALDGKNNALLWFMGQVQLHGEQKGEVELISRGKYGAMKKKVFKQYMEDNQEHISIILPYITGTEFISKSKELEDLEAHKALDVTDVTLKDEVVSEGL